MTTIEIPDTLFTIDGWWTITEHAYVFALYFAGREIYTRVMADDDYNVASDKFHDLIADKFSKLLED